ncbi:hypothetical protein [Lactococcus lactis]|uniref:hypothetical protein n=1 Tax=Lactococcus lactis TaxID=1358 RepID=UPI0032E399B4
MKPITINDLAKVLKVSVGVLLVLCQVNGIEVEDENSEITLEQSALLTQALKENDSVVPSMETKPTKKKNQFFHSLRKNLRLVKRSGKKKKKRVLIKNH